MQSDAVTLPYNNLCKHKVMEGAWHSKLGQYDQIFASILNKYSSMHFIKIVCLLDTSKRNKTNRKVIEATKYVVLPCL